MRGIILSTLKEMALNIWDEGQKKKALRDLEQRRKKAAKLKRVDNSSLFAGSPMTYYCLICGLVSGVLPESHITPAPRHCAPCKELVEHGYSRSTERFEEQKNSPKFKQL